MLEDEKYHFVLSMNTEYAVDPVLLQERLLAYGYHISKIEKRNINQWVYEVWQGDFQYPKAILLTINETNNHANPKGEYWYKIQEGKNISFASVGGVSWYPKIVFFDKNLKIINIVSSQDSMREINLKIPENTSFIKVSDTRSNVRLDKYLKVSRLIKRRTVANDACDAARITVNGKAAKASYQVKVGDVIEIAFGQRTMKVEVLAVAEHALKADAAALYKELA